jgi:hypothetical protein
MINLIIGMSIGVVVIYIGISFVMCFTLVYAQMIADELKTLDVIKKINNNPQKNRLTRIIHKIVYKKYLN